MKAAVFVEQGILEVRDVPEPSISASDEVLLKVSANGVCGTDVHALDIPPRVAFWPGVTIGHEFSGVVAEAGPASGVVAGDRLAVLPQIPCHRCRQCREGRVNLCLNMSVFGAYERNGGAAEYVVAPRETLYRIDDDLPLDRAALGEPLSVVLSASTRLPWHPGRATVIFGAGPIGLLFLLLAQGAGASPLIVVEPAAGRRARARELGADAVVDPSSGSVEDVVSELTPEGAEIAIDAVGTLLPEAMAIAAPGATVVVYGINGQARVEVPPYQILRKELRITGTFLAKNTFQLALHLLSENKLGFDRLITDRIPLEEVNYGLDKLRRGEAVKVLLHP